MGYGYRSMSADELKGYTMEVQFDATGCDLTLFAGDQWHYTKYRVTFDNLKAWRDSGRYPGYADWIRSEFVRQVLNKPEAAANMPWAGVAKWCHTDRPTYDNGAIDFITFLTKWQEEV